MPEVDATALSDVANHELNLSASDASLLNMECIDGGTVPSDAAPAAPPASGAAAAEDGARAVPLARRTSSGAAESDDEKSVVSFAKTNTSMRSGLSIPAAPTAKTFQYIPPPAARGVVSQGTSRLHADEPMVTAIAETENFGLKKEAMDELDSSAATDPVSSAAAEAEGSSGFKYAPKPKPRGILKGKLGRLTPKRPGLKRAGSVEVMDKHDSIFDIDGDGVLDEIEQAMRDRDLNHDGTLDNREVHNIIQDQLKSQNDYGMYKKWAAALTVLVGILALSNFGTSWASALLAKDTSADAESGAVQSKGSGEVVGYQGTSHLFEIEELSEDEFDQRRLLVDAEMAEDLDHPDHAHRRLGKKKNNKCSCTKIGYDHGKVKESALIKLANMCDGARTVQMRRTWKNGDIMDEDYDTICDPGTEIVRTGKKKGGNNKNKNNNNKNDKNNKNKNNKNKITVFEEELIEFRKKDKNGKTKSVSFNCRGGDCFSSGQSFHQDASHPCKIERDVKGASECVAGLACYDPDDHSARRGQGICARLQEFARRDQVCDVSLGIDACEANYACYATTDRGIELSAGTVRRGNCRRVSDNSGPGEICNVGLGIGACVLGYQCLGANGRKINRGIGLCRLSSKSPGGSGGSPSGAIAKFVRAGQPCNMDYGLDACMANYACYVKRGNPFDVGGGQATCQAVGLNVRVGGVCNVSNNLGACANGLQCLGNDGRTIQGGFGVCSNGGGRNGDGGGVVKSGGCSTNGGCLPAQASWAVDCTYTCSCMSGTCMKNCVPGSDRWFCY